VLLEFFDDLRAHGLVGLLRVALKNEPDRSTGDVLGSEVGRHDDDGVLEVDDSTLAVSEPAFLENLQQRVEDVGVCLFDFIEQHDTERLASNALGELAALVESDVSGRGAEEARCGVLLAVLRHIERDECIFVVKQELGESFGELGLSDTGRTGEDKRTRRALRVFEPSTGASDRLRENGNSFFLADDALVKCLLHHEETCAFLFGQLEDGNSGCLCENLGDDAFVNRSGVALFTLAPFLFKAEALSEKLLLLVAELGSLFVILLFDGRFLLLANNGDLVVEFAQLGRRRKNGEAHACAGFVDEVDGLVWQESVLHVTVGEGRRCDNASSVIDTLWNAS
jgi:hypothetical protein